MHGIFSQTGKCPQEGTNMSLTDTAIKAIKPTGKAQKITDGKGLFPYVTPAGEQVVAHGLPFW